MVSLMWIIKPNAYSMAVILGKAYSAKMILERTGIKDGKFAPSLADEKKNLRQHEVALKDSSASHSQQGESKLLEILTSADSALNYVPYQLKKKRKQKKKKQLKF